MPKPSQQYLEREAAIKAALTLIQSTNEPNIALCCRETGASIHSVRRRLKGTPSRSARVPSNKKLSELQEQALLRWISIMDEMGIGARFQYIEIVANELLAKDHDNISTSPPRVGSHWVQRFVNRHPDLHIHRQAPRELARKVAVTKEDLKEWYKKLKKKMDEYGVLLDDLWNCDEVGFRVGVGGVNWVVTFEMELTRNIASPQTRESVTVIECVSATGWVIDPCVIMPTKVHLESYFANDLPPGTLFAATPTGFTNDLLGLEWVRHFDRCTKATRKGRYRLLLVDGHGSHLTLQFIDYCHANDIIVFALPPHATHLLQPLDLSVFQPMKHWHKEAIDRQTRLGNSSFNKNDFLANLDWIRKQTFKVNTIKAGWRTAGLVPWNPSSVIGLVRAATPPPPVLPSSPHTPTHVQSSSPPITPQTIRSLRRLGGKLLNREVPVTPSKVKRFVDGSLMQAYVGSLAVDQLKDMGAEAKAKQARDSRGRHTWKGGVVNGSLGRVIAEEKLAQMEANDARREAREAALESRRQAIEARGEPLPPVLVRAPPPRPVQYGKPRTYTQEEAQQWKRARGI